MLRTNFVSGDGKREWLHEVKVLDKIEALKILAKHFGLLVDRVELSGDDELIRRLQAGRARLQPHLEQAGQRREEGDCSPGEQFSSSGREDTAYAESIGFLISGGKDHEHRA